MKSASDFIDWQPGRFNPWYRPGPSERHLKGQCDCMSCMPRMEFTCWKCDVRWAEPLPPLVEQSLCWHCGSWVALE